MQNECNRPDMKFNYKQLKGRKKEGEEGKKEEEGEGEEE